MIKIDKIQNKLIDAIKRSGFTQVELAKQLKINQSTISRYLSGQKSPSLEIFANLCAVLDLDPHDILCIDSYSEN